MTTEEIPIRFELDLPVRRTPRVVCWIAQTLGVVYALFALLIASHLSVLAILSALFSLWISAFIFLMGSVGNVAPKLRKRDSCVINCIAIALEYIDRKRPADQLAAELGLNKETRGTPLHNLMVYLTVNYYRHRSFSLICEDSLRQTLLTQAVPMMLIVDRPYLSDWVGWIFNPMTLLVKPKYFPEGVAHAILIYGFDESGFSVYDPAASTLHRVDFEWLKKHKVDNAYGDGTDLLAVLGKSDAVSSLKPLDDLGWSFTIGI